jgi:membrane-associated phospholipid phosphatase
MRRALLLAAFGALFATNAEAAGNAGKAVAIALPVFAGGVTLLHDWDWKGLGQLTLDTGLTIGTALALKQLVREQRPDKSDFRSFPSLTTAVAFAPATYLWDRYGWEYGAPATIAAGYVGYSVVDAKEHHWYDALASAGIAWTYSHFITSRWHNRHFESDVYATPGGAYVRLNYTW